MKQPFTLAAATLLLVACSDNPVAPPQGAPVASTKAARSASESSAQLDFTDLSNDVIARLLPSFDDQQTAKSIETSLLALNTHALAGEIADAQAASQAIRSALKEGVASAVLLDAMYRTLDVVDRDLAATMASSGTFTVAP